jgi:uncharacterized pyridoxamine 5'-phosphate oxidase family protein
LALLKDEETVYLATLDGRAPRVRPVTLIRHTTGFYVITSTLDAKIKQITAVPSVEICVPLSGERGRGYLRITGTMSIQTDPDIRRDVADSASYFIQYWNSWEDSDYTLLSLDIESIDHMHPRDTYPKKYLVRNG